MLSNFGSKLVRITHGRIAGSSMKKKQNRIVVFLAFDFNPLLDASDFYGLMNVDFRHCKFIGQEAEQKNYANDPFFQIEVIVS
jgi:hypothetical protein